MTCQGPLLLLRGTARKMSTQENARHFRSGYIHNLWRAPRGSLHRGSPRRCPRALGKLISDLNTPVCTLGCMANLHTTLPVYSTSLSAALTSQSNTSFLVSTRILGISETIPTLIDSGATSNFIDLALASMSIFVPTALAKPITLSLFDGKPATS